jgi:hypothetical protein
MRMLTPRMLTGGTFSFQTSPLMITGMLSESTKKQPTSREAGRILTVMRPTKFR